MSNEFPLSSLFELCLFRDVYIVAEFVSMHSLPQRIHNNKKSQVCLVFMICVSKYKNVLYLVFFTSEIATC